MLPRSSAHFNAGSDTFTFHEGGQAIIGNVETPGGGQIVNKKKDQPDA
jgi:hypothetical protein